MNSFKILLSASLLALSAAPSLAGDTNPPGDGSNILNTQIKMGQLLRFSRAKIIEI